MARCFPCSVGVVGNSDGSVTKILSRNDKVQAWLRERYDVNRCGSALTVTEVAIAILRRQQKIAGGLVMVAWRAVSRLVRMDRARLPPFNPANDGDIDRRQFFAIFFLKTS